ncbi:ribokinase [Tsukamurella sp. 8F]|uniref:ribokinase n=1 Tax=unclassified Tsukamurella TaxID=2633480 RepID=UPI0023BA2AAF|nr:MULTISPECIES: ribokinase [unclassified Tsukamurella]MDF0531355.1 ribokinase [Tsukamurella sp. 8J]MDF0588561.1 ribokinase [Tsukamurella sp. 8F]
MSGTVAVVGSLNADLTLYTERMPAPGETVAGTGFEVHPGGKSANQAVAAARLGARVRLVGAVGDDAHGAMLRGSAADAGVDVADVRTVAGVPTGVAGITVDARGENSIVIVAGANGRLSPSDVPARAVDGAGVVCLCLEVPQPTVLAAARAGRQAGATVILNLSPYAQVSRELAAVTDVLLVNVHEASEVLGYPPDGDWERVARGLGDAGFGCAIITLGAAGAVVIDGRTATCIAPTPVDAVDTTGAGDAFTGALAAQLADGESVERAARFASAAAALATTRRGTQTAYATLDEVRALQPGIR